MPQTSITHLLVDTGTMQRLQEVNTGPGRFEKQYVDLSVDIACRVWTASARDIALAQQLRMNGQHVGYLEPDQDVATSDQLVRTAREGITITPEYYRITGVLDPSLVHHRKVMLERVTTGA